MNAVVNNLFFLYISYFARDCTYALALSIHPRRRNPSLDFDSVHSSATTSLASWSRRRWLFEESGEGGGAKKKRRRQAHAWMEGTAETEKGEDLQRVSEPDRGLCRQSN